MTCYTDATGMPFEAPIPVAGHETAWPFTALTEFLPLAPRGEGQARLAEAEELPTPEAPPYTEPQATLPEPGTIPYALAQPDTTQVELPGKAVTAVFPNENPPCFYIQEDDRCAGIKVVPLSMPWNLQRGDRVDLNFSVSTDSNDERILLQESSQYLFTHTHGYGLMPLTMSTRSLWCGPASDYTTAVEVGGVAGNGIYAIGQFVRIGGKVTAVDPQGTWFTVSDGAATFLNGAITDETANPGIRVHNAEGYTVQVGDDVLVAGVAGLRKVGANVYPVLRALPCPSWDLVLRPAHVVIGHCDTESEVTATLLECGKPAANRQVEFVTSSPLAFEGVSGAVTYATTDAAGKAAVTIERSGPFGYGESSISAFYGTGSGTAASAPVSVVLDEWRLQIETAHFWIYQNEQYSVTAKLTRLDGVPVDSHSVTLQTDTGLFNGTSAQHTACTNGDGEISATLVIGTCPGTATITASTDVPQCNDPVTTSKLLQVLCPNTTPTADLVFCIDSTMSMRYGGENNLAYAGMTELCECAAASGAIVRYGGVKFGDVISDTFSMSTDKAAFLEWLAEFDNAYDGGGDGPENPLAALEAAAAMAPGCFIALATDDLYHQDDAVTELTAAEVAADLAAAGCRVFIDPYYYPRLHPAYRPLAVNGAVHSSGSTPGYSDFPFTPLRLEFGCNP